MLSTLSPALETLCLVSSDSDQAFRNYSPSHTASKPSFIETDYGRGKSTWIDAGALFPRLTRLEIGRWEFYIDQFFDERDLAGLPSTLRELKVSHIYRLLMQGSVMRALPRTLERLEAQTKWSPHSVADWQNAPPNLTYVSGIYCSHNVDSVDYAPWIPPTIEIGSMQTSNDDWTAQRVLGQLPPTIRQLSVNNLHASSFDGKETDWMGSTPRSLTSLEVRLHSAFSRAVLTQLPPHLTYLHITVVVKGATIFGEFRGEQEHGTSSLWPKTLHTLVLGPNCDAKDIRLVPKTLTILEMQFNPESYGLYKFEAEDLPRNLKTLALVTSHFKPAHRVNSGIFLPSLTSYGISFTSGKNLPLHVFSRGLIESQLPSSLKHLSFRMTAVPSPTEAPWVLPSQLLTLKTSIWRIQWLKSLPRTITTLSITTLCGLRELRDNGPIDLFAHLPTALTSLNLDSHSQEKFLQCTFSTSSLASLSQLYDLTCSAVYAFPSSIFKDLPKSLRRLDVSLNSDNPEDAPFLPSSLHMCTINEGRLAWETTALTKHWPPQCRLPVPEIGGTSL